MPRLTPYGGNDLVGTIPTWLGDWSVLSQLSRSFNNLTGTIPSELGKLIDLTALNLNVNRLSGPIPSEFGHLALALDCCRVSIPTTLPQQQSGRRH